jgi:ornithine cyclodeaminase
MQFLDAKYVRQHLTYELCIDAVRKAMISLSVGETRQLLRSFIHLEQGRMFGIMPGAMGEKAVFGAKLISIFPENFAIGHSSHHGVVVLFEREMGTPICVVDASSVTAIRTAAASAAATDVLAKTEASTLAILGYGEQAHSHAHAITKVRNIEQIRIWGRAPERAQVLVNRLTKELTCRISVARSVDEAVNAADIICTVTAAPEPILSAEQVAAGAHINAVGSGYAGPSEITEELVAKTRFIADSRESVLAQGAEFIRTKEADLISDDHIVAEIGEIFSGMKVGRRNNGEITIYKSLGHIVQDLAPCWLLYNMACAQE